MSSHLSQDANMNGVYVRSDVSSMLSFDGSESRESMDDSKKGHQSLVEWLNETLPYLKLPWEASEDELRACLRDGTVLCSLLNQLSPGSMRMGGSFEPASVKIERFLTAMDEMALPRFEVSDIEQGDMVPVLQSLKALKASFSDGSYDKNSLAARRRWSLPEDHSDSRGDDRNFTDGFQSKEGSEIDMSDAKISDLLKSNSLRNAPTRSLFDMLDKLLDESMTKMNGHVSHAMASLLSALVQVIEQRISNQADNLKNQNILFRVREEKYRSRIKVLESLAAGTTKENEIVTNCMEHIKLEKTRIEEKERSEEKDVVRLRKEKERSDAEIRQLKQELKLVKETHENQCLELEAKAQKTRDELEKKLKDAELHVVDSSRKVKELEKLCQSKSQRWEKKECIYQNFIDNHSGALQELSATSLSIKHEVVRTQRKYFEDLNYYGLKLKGVADAAKNYHVVLEENRRLYNEVQELKGNIRVYCRIRPFLPGQNSRQTTIEYIGETGELVVANPFKQGKDTHRLFKFNKVFDQAATQEEVFLDTRPLIRSILDGYNVCIFAYGQTGSGKTYTMSGPSITSKEDWGVNYRALNDLFLLTQSRQNTVMYEVGVQMVEIYNEQVRDILSDGGSSRRLGIWNTALPNGLAVPDASMHCVRSTEDVLELMNIGLMNRTVGATALNERSSRSHCVLSVHVRGVDVETDSILRGSLHLVDLAGSERVDRSEATGERLKEAQHINKSLSALGDVIFALAHKNPHVPYRNSKLTQVLQSSLGGQAKTLMFVQVNPDGDSYAETVSTLKFAERVSGVELGAAKSSKEGRDVRQLMEQVSNLKDVIAKKDEELQNFQKVKGNNATSLKRGLSNLRLVGPTSPRRHSIGASPNARRGKASGLFGRGTSDVDNCSEYSSKHSDSGSQQSSDERKHQKDYHQPSKFAGAAKGIDFDDEDVELVGLADADSEDRLSDISDSCLSMGTETDGSISSAVELTLFPETAKPLELIERPEARMTSEKLEKSVKMGKTEPKDRTNIPSKIPKQTLKPPGQTRPSRLSIATSSSSKALTGAKRPTISTSSSAKPLNRRR
ncbi:P-loop nucleoside triphosphate hydrolases superfamily protein with CH (Calponin Homology) domain-containing protein [Arabidopsis thaliana]|uniref:Kinesin-like protein KIN-14J n=2 Tax=Arabidopsis thaliana TaxID=3702 RepID=KN14J_ARATH|nr:P-loop nucleoside triphosphate hydrolases superfamily protein with CH (Calponin Homology) domain-containing protein [Arabidopsis thaliana]NP_176551.3 P-loop nucleoside triphosphate hydrolases superfamily protein with CH (Calponin Homology) domain-containing protein [Arabidopsis thaliana]B3H6Z8.1 RecName: Full=Kinesin-like protein KIN-14J; AltName: Full=Kinesin KinG [Arabidopsis thaliana]AEE34122.1 P-loop nucleoside triphosphate hydrolases superfamily protein with CH (Calponin Homology) domain|eukprot:NP_001322194.1 P-loop nucleoside triphosphate hydrolases superfamily protein with CH (Calponin Homology) domain-containing protein [Arabidopsis thaliana]